MSQGVPGPTNTTPGCHGDSCMSIMVCRVYLMSMVMVSLWQMVDQVFYSFSVMFYSLPSLRLLCFCLLIYISLFIGLLIWVSKSILLFIWIMMTGIIYLYPSCSHSLSTKPSICLHSLSRWAMSPLPSSSSSVRRSVGCRRSRREPGERWKKRGSDYSSSRSDTHTQEVSFIYTHIQAHVQP